MGAVCSAASEQTMDDEFSRRHAVCYARSEMALRAPSSPVKALDTSTLYRIVAVHSSRPPNISYLYIFLFNDTADPGAGRRVSYLPE